PEASSSIAEPALAQKSLFLPDDAYGIRSVSGGSHGQECAFRQLVGFAHFAPVLQGDPNGRLPAPALSVEHEHAWSTARAGPEIEGEGFVVLVETLESGARVSERLAFDLAVALH